MKFELDDLVRVFPGLSYGGKVGRIVEVVTNHPIFSYRVDFSGESTWYAENELELSVLDMMANV